jgi:hypothetical protein
VRLPAAAQQGKEVGKVYRSARRYLETSVLAHQVLQYAKGTNNSVERRDSPHASCSAPVQATTIPMVVRQRPAFIPSSSCKRIIRTVEASLVGVRVARLAARQPYS